MHRTVPDIRRDVMKVHTLVSEFGDNVTSTHTMVSDIHRTVVKGDGKNLLVSTLALQPSPNDRSPLCRLEPGQQLKPQIGL